MGEVQVMTAEEERDYLAELLDDSLWREKALEERCARAEQRVRDLEEAQGELLGLLDGKRGNPKPMSSWELAHIPETAAMDTDWALEIFWRLQATVRDLEAKLDHERRTNTALRLEIDRWRANDEGRAVRLREALEQVVITRGRWWTRQIARAALAADREGR